MKTVSTCRPRIPAVLRAAFLLFFALACNIKEVRDGCPCVLSIYPDKSLDYFIDKSVLNSFRVMDAATGQLYHSGVFDMDNFAGGKAHKIRVPKSVVMINSVFGGANMKDEGRILRITSGSQADSVFVCNKTGINCTGEECSDTLSLAKQWCSMRISFMSTDTFSVTSCSVSGSWNGFDTASLTATKGDFFFDAEHIAENNFAARLPRQGDNSLILTVYSENPSFQRQYELGKLIAEANYDWNEPSLNDLVVFIDRSEVKIEIVLPDWDRGENYGNLEM